MNANNVLNMRRQIRFVTEDTLLNMSQKKFDLTSNIFKLVISLK